MCRMNGDENGERGVVHDSGGGGAVEDGGCPRELAGVSGRETETGREGVLTYSASDVSKSGIVIPTAGFSFKFPNV